MRFINFTYKSIALLLSAVVLFSCQPEQKPEDTEKEPTPEQPKGYDVNFNAPILSGYYYGTTYTGGSHEYWFSLSDKGFHEDGSPYPEALYYRLDLYAVSPANESNPVIPVGEYSLDLTNSGKVGTFAEQSCLFYTTDENGKGNERYKFTEGKLIVENSEVGIKLTLDITTEDGLHRCVTYEGPCFLKVYTKETPVEPTVGYAKRDINVQMNSVSAYYYEKVNKTMDNIVMEFSNMDIDEEGLFVPPGFTCQVDLVTDLTEEGKVKPGVYPISADDSSLTAYPGYYKESEAYIPQGTYALEIDSDMYYGVAPLKSGTFTVSENGSQISYILEGVDLNGIKVYCSYTGEGIYFENFPEDEKDPEENQSDIDVKFNDGSIIRAYFFGSTYDSNYDPQYGQWAIYVAPDAGVEGQVLNLSFLSPKPGFSPKISDGTYTVAPSHEGKYPNQLEPGYKDGGYPAGSYWCIQSDGGAYDQGACKNFLPIVDGSCTLTTDSNGVSTLEFDFIESNGYHIRGKISSIIDFYNPTFED